MISFINKPFKWFFKLEAASGLILLIAAIIALIVSNTNLSTLYFDLLNKHSNSPVVPMSCDITFSILLIKHVFFYNNMKNEFLI